MSVGGVGGGAQVPPQSEFSAAISSQAQKEEQLIADLLNVFEHSMGSLANYPGLNEYIAGIPPTKGHGGGPGVPSLQALMDAYAANPSPKNLVALENRLRDVVGIMKQVAANSGNPIDKAEIYLAVHHFITQSDNNHIEV